MRIMKMKEREWTKKEITKAMLKDIYYPNLLPVGTVLWYSDAKSWLDDTTIPGWFSYEKR